MFVYFVFDTKDTSVKWDISAMENDFVGNFVAWMATMLKLQRNMSSFSSNLLPKSEVKINRK